ncbi:hypothetical protein ACIOG8_03940 [Streptomyces erythrochromogenes]|uniref:hypothetical protein n=1 Tax=Streptomyces erythrochromogenes TaxID=285574 RepID=UPI0038005762
MRANTAMVTLMAAANIAGRGAGGAPVAALTAPFAPTRPSAAYLASALRLTAIRSTPAPAPAARTPLTAQLREGLHPVRGRPAARPGTGPTLNNLGGAVLGGAVLGGAVLGGAVLGTMLRMLFVRELGLPPAGSVGLLLGARPALRGGPWATGAPYC